MHNGGIAGATVANSAATDNSGGIFNSVTTIGMPPASTNKNLLVVCFIDEATSQSLQQPYHDNGPNAAWNSATDGTGTVTPFGELIMKNLLFKEIYGCLHKQVDNQILFISF